MLKAQKIEIVGYLLSICASIGVALFGIYILDPNIGKFAESKDIIMIVSSVMLSFFLLTLVALAKITYVQSLNRKLVIENHEEIVRINKLQKYNAELLNILVNLSEKGDILNATGRASISKFLNEFDVRDNSIEFRSEGLALSSYRVFWKELVDLQESQKKKKLIARITHSNPIDVWDKAGDEDYIYQKEFIDNGGIVIRVLIDFHCRPDELKAYLRVFKEMKSKGIHPIYLPLNGKGDRPKYDFVVVDTVDFSYIVKWFSDIGGRQIASSAISRHPSKSRVQEKEKLKIISDKIRKREFDDAVPDILKEKVPEDILKILSGS